MITATCAERYAVPSVLLDRDRWPRGSTLNLTQFLCAKQRNCGFRNTSVLFLPELCDGIRALRWVSNVQKTLAHQWVKAAVKGV